MNDIIIKHKKEEFLAYITHWEHFFINRATGYIINKAFTYTIMTGEDEGKSYAHSVQRFDTDFDVIGSMKNSIEEM